MDLRKLKSILDLFSTADIAEMKIPSGDEKIHLIRHGAETVAQVASPSVASSAAASTNAQPESAAAEVDTGTIIVSPMVGTFYRSPSPDRPPFVQVGQRIEKGQTICIIEAMKLMNEIPAAEGGIVRSIAAENGQPVSYGDPLIVLE